ncbi:MAG: NfeD family protein [Planctomycetota bacterium]
MRRTLFLLLVLVPAAFAQGPENRGPFQKVAVLHLKEAADEAIDPSVKTSILRRLEEAKEWGADCIVLEIESYGGYVHSSIELGDEIYDLGRDIHTIAYIPRRAISGAAMLSFACREIVMNEVGAIGDSQAISMGPEGSSKAAEKIQTVVANTFKTYASGNGYPVPVAMSMVRQEMEVTRYKKPNDKNDPAKGFTWFYFRSDDGDDEPTQAEVEERGLSDRELVVREGELATFGAKEAINFGICSRTERTLADLLGSIRAPNAEVRTMDWNWAERTSRWLLGWKAILFLVGLGALYFALKIPGTGVPEALAIICFGLFFGASAVSGLAGSFEVILFLAGILLLVVEIFVLPGFGVAGIAGLACILVAIGMAAVPEGSYDNDVSHYLIPVARDFFLGVAGSIVLAVGLARVLPTVPLFRRLALIGGPTEGSQTGSAAGYTAGDDLVGTVGIAESQLRPSGRAILAGIQRDVVSDGDLIQPGAEIKVIAVRGNVVVVRATEEPGA